MLRKELDQSHKHWMKNNCFCKGHMVMNLDEFEPARLKSVRKHVSEGEIVILPTDKSGRFPVMTMDTYIKAGMVDVEGTKKSALMTSNTTR